MTRALGAAGVAAELGRSADWLYDNWQRLVAEKRLPPPILERGGLVWNAAQLYAVLDKGLTREQRATAAAFRAALAAAVDVDPAGLDEAAGIARARAELATKFARVS